MKQEMNINRLYVIPLIETVIFPEVNTKVKLNKAIGQKINKLWKEGTQFIGLTVTGENEADLPALENFYRIGVLLKVIDIQPADSGYILQAVASCKVIVDNLSVEGGVAVAEYRKAEEIVDLDEKSKQEMLAYIKETVRDLSRHFQGSEAFVEPILTLDSAETIMSYILPYMAVTVAEKQELLEAVSLRDKCIRFIDLLIKQKESIHLQIEMAKKISQSSNKNYRQTLLREQLKAIQDELHEEDGAQEDGYKVKIEKANMPTEVKKVALSEFKKLEAMGSNNPESHIIRNYLDLLIALPWITDTSQKIDIEAARQVLESQHHGLEEVKSRIIQHLAVMKLKGDKQGSILLLVGPPGTGKTSLGKSIAEALGREYVRTSLGGIRDEAEIRGHRRTYVGALPGRIIAGIKKAGKKNPVFILDEIDKLAVSYAGDPASALLEVLDPEQNNTFADHYLEVPYDLSDVLFIATANSMNTIPAPLLDRMEVIQISSYTNYEKTIIGRKHLLPQSLTEHGLNESQLTLDEIALVAIIEKYTREAGVRGLKKMLDKIARVASEKIVSGKVTLPWQVTEDLLTEILGQETFHHDQVLTNQRHGVVTGLAWTPVGGDVLFTEATFMPGRGELTLTGQLGDVMKESARISLSLIRSRLTNVISNFDFIKSDIHIHVPSGATPKDGPSAGITLFTTLASLILGIKVDSKLAMTGEITLRGSVLPVGGIKEKMLAAHRAGIKTVILPRDNEKDLKELPDEVRAEIKFIPVDSVEQVLKEALGIDIPQPEIFGQPPAQAVQPV